MNLGNKIGSVILGELRSLDILRIDSFARQNHEVLNFHLDQGNIDCQSMDGALENAIILQAYVDYRMMTERPSYRIAPDHAGRPDCFAYALWQGEFSEKRLEKIPFDRGETVDSFVSSYLNSNLPAELRETLLNPPQEPREEHPFYYRGILDEHP